MADKEFTYAEVSTHTTKKDVHLVIHDIVYDVTSFVDEHPGGEEVILDVGGQDATEAFEDVGHSDEAREVLEGLKIGVLKRSADDPKPKVSQPANTSSSSSGSGSGGFGIGLYAVVLVAALAYGAYHYLELNAEKA
ncbi:cytochrome b5-like heme/steroid binding domain-containing protein [Talaromyces proteolyticus]|uniref:Cytochrome b5-like heme/steroid binding domain-containing protein n=1 Tax=Talaromyces proteolyticus TaxID=1131652 RepID=A0AAD4KZV6_9EURO|nr:cytochrome b5-like heme/steroid binding domain-containing protein [Talaromyces proteolyticus]KAH8704957.1 cytochrome b5-like heme/steroid binding domain-containing protein [Talaromyces proteolyticus]